MDVHPPQNGAIGSASLNQWYYVGAGALPIVVYFSGD